eukprot:1237641-Pyramimonas_sp.AAC.1
MRRRPARRRTPTGRWRRRASRPPRRSAPPLPTCGSGGEAAFSVAPAGWSPAHPVNTNQTQEA